MLSHRLGVGGHIRRAQVREHVRGDALGRGAVDLVGAARAALVHQKHAVALQRLRNPLHQHPGAGLAGPALEIRDGRQGVVGRKLAAEDADVA